MANTKTTYQAPKMIYAVLHRLTLECVRNAQNETLTFSRVSDALGRITMCTAHAPETETDYCVIALTTVQHLS